MIKRQETHTSPDRSQTPTSRGQLLQTNEDQGIGEEHFDVGCFYVVNHQNLPTRTPVQLKSIRVVAVTAKTDLNVSLKYPSIESLRNYLRRDKMSSNDSYPVLDEVFVMETHLAGKVLGCQISTQELNENSDLLLFWLIKNSPKSTLSNLSGAGPSTQTTKLPKVEHYVDLDSLFDGQSVRLLYDQLANILCDGESVIKFDIDKTTTTAIEQFLMFLNIKSGKQLLTLFIRTLDVYVVGFKNEMNDDCFMLLEPLERMNKKEEDTTSKKRRKNFGIPCLIAHGYIEETIHSLTFGGAYHELEDAAVRKRALLKIGEKQLKKSFETLCKYKLGDDSQGVARALLFFTQFVSEPVRILEQAELIIKAFTKKEYVIFPKEIFLYQQGWSFASMCVKRDLRGLKQDVYRLLISKGSDPLTIPEMRMIFRIFLGGKNFGGGGGTDIKMLKKNCRTKIMEDYYA